MGNIFKLARYIEFRNTKIQPGILNSREFPKTLKFITMSLDYFLSTTHESIKLGVQAMVSCELDV